MPQPERSARRSNPFLRVLTSLFVHHLPARPADYARVNEAITRAIMGVGGLAFIAVVVRAAASI